MREAETGRGGVGGLTEMVVFYCQLYFINQRD